MRGAIATSPVCDTAQLSAPAGGAGKAIWWERLTGARHLPILTAILAAALAAPSLRSGWETDDHFFRLAFTRPEAAAEVGIHNTATPGGLFTFIDGDPTHTRRLMETGVIPWWSHTEILSSFLRPIAVLTHWLDFRLWPERPWLMHAHSLLWYAALAAAASALYRAQMGPITAAGLAGLLYAVDDAHATPAGWIANRNALLTTLFGVLALIAHHRWRGSGHRRAAVAAPLLLALSLLSGEAGVATAGYVAAFALAGDTGSWRRRLTGVLPAAAVVIVWRIAWTVAGFGSKGMGLYVDPLLHPLGFLAALGERLPVMLLGQLALPPPDVTLFLDERAATAVWLAGVGFLALAAFVLWPLLRADHRARYYALGMTLALVPCCATLPSERNMLFVGVGAMGLLGRFLAGIGSKHGATWFQRNQPGADAGEQGRDREGAGEGRSESRDLRRQHTPAVAGQRGAPSPIFDYSNDGLESRSTGPAVGMTPTGAVGLSRHGIPPDRLLRQWATRALVVIHLVIAPTALLARAAMPLGPRRITEQLHVRTPLGDDACRQSVVVVNAPSAFHIGYLPIARAVAGQCVPRQTRVLAPSLASVTLKRTDARTLVVTPEDGYLALPYDELFRGREHPLAVSDRVSLSDMSVEIAAQTADGRPAEAVFRFSAPLEDGSFRWLFWQDGTFRDFTPPAVGETVTLGKPAPRW
ncbi:MAG: hypothetical protein HY763_03045 [Planctomycetes bacterium]|nr:hypothetical protein [Planctomycetota bacterium]